MMRASLGWGPRRGLGFLHLKERPHVGCNVAQHPSVGHLPILVYWPPTSAVAQPYTGKVASTKATLRSITE